MTKKNSKASVPGPEDARIAAFDVEPVGDVVLVVRCHDQHDAERADHVQPEVAVLLFGRGGGVCRESGAGVQERFRW